MNDLIWRIRFTLAVSWILRDQWCRNKKLYLKLGWDVARNTKPLGNPYQTALHEMTKWYTE